MDILESLSQMPVLLTRKETFCASHRLYNPSLSPLENERIYGICARPNGHGHNYELWVTVKAVPEPKTGMVMSIADLKQVIKRELVDLVDHFHLNEDVSFLREINPTTENLAAAFWLKLQPHLPGLYEIKLFETPNNWATCYGK